MSPDDRFDSTVRATGEPSSVTAGDSRSRPEVPERDERHTHSEGRHLNAGESGHPRWAALRARWRRVRDYVRGRRTLNIGYRLAVALIGSAVAGAGVAMLALPGPGWAAIFVGLAILATEFHWARRLLQRARATYEVAKERALDPRVRRRNQLMGVAAVVLVVAAATFYVVRYGVPFG